MLYTIWNLDQAAFSRFHVLFDLLGQRCIAHCTRTTYTGIPKADTCTLYKGGLAFEKGERLGTS